jgi:hypothetical protein
MVPLVRAVLAQGIARRPVLFLLGLVLLAGAATVLALGAADRLVVGGGLEREEGVEETVEVTLVPSGALSRAVEREALVVIESGLVSDPAVVAVSRDAKGENTTFVVTVSASSASELREASQRVASRVDPGPFEKEVAGETVTLAEARAGVEDELPGLLLLALPFALLVTGLSYGPRLAAAPILAALLASAGAVAILRFLPAGLDLTNAGVAAAVAVGMVIAIEACAVVRRAHGAARFGAQESMLDEALAASAPRFAWAFAGAVLAAGLLMVIPLASALSAALGAIAAAAIAGVAGPLAMAAVLALVPPTPPPEAPPSRSEFADRLPPLLARVADEVAVRPALSWIPALLALALLVAAAVPLADAQGFALTPVAGVATEATELIQERAMWILAAVTIVGVAAAYLATRSARLSLARGIGAALPAGAACGLLALAADGSLPFDVGALEDGAYASTYLVAMATLGAIGVARGSLGDRGGALCSTLVAGAAFGVLAAVELDAVAQLGIVIAAGLATDLVLVRAVLVPSLERALPQRRPALWRPSLPRPRVPRPRVPDRFRR